MYLFVCECIQETVCLNKNCGIVLIIGIDALADLISQTHADVYNVRSVKQDKTAVLSDTVLQVNALIGQALPYFNVCQFLVSTC